MNTINGNFIEKSIPNIKNATIALNIGGIDATMTVEKFAAAINAEPVAPYKVFTGLLTQSSGSDELYVENFTITGTQNIVKGTSYFIDVNSENVDFSLIGAPSNVVGTNFIATVDKLNTDFPDITWALRFNTGAPVVTILENTLGNVWFIYGGAGQCAVESDNLFTNLKSTLIVGNCFWETGTGYVLTGFDGTSSGPIKTFSFLNTPVNEYLINTPIEIKVYN